MLDKDNKTQTVGNEKIDPVKYFDGTLCLDNLNNALKEYYIRRNIEYMYCKITDGGILCIPQMLENLYKKYREDGYMLVVETMAMDFDCDYCEYHTIMDIQTNSEGIIRLAAVKLPVLYVSIIERVEIRL